MLLLLPLSSLALSLPIEKESERTREEVKELKGAALRRWKTMC